MSSFKFLEREQVFGEKKLNILEKYGIKASITDFSILLGGAVDGDNFTTEGTELSNRTCSYWTMETVNSNDVISVNSDGEEIVDEITERMTGSRIAIPYSDIKQLSNKVKYERGIKEVEYGEYPQTVVSNELSNYLEKLYNEGKLKVTGKQYTTDSNSIYSGILKFEARNHVEYFYEGKKYIRFPADGNCQYETLSNGNEVKEDDIFWIEVEPIKWLVDEEENIALSKKILFAGVQFNQHIYDKIDFEESDIKKFIDDYFSKDIIPSKTFVIDSQEIKDKTKKNIYGFEFSEVTEEEIIRGAVESNIAVFLHGKSSEGKSARVKQIDPDCEIIYLRNATPDSLNGKSVFNSSTNEMIDIPPTWYKKVVEKCEREPDKIHIVFFDEITNALPSIQGMAFNIVLDGEVNGKWKLPDNARIVAAGNDLEDSKAAEEMAEPLFNRFAHVYINTTVDDWLKWASTPSEEYERLDYKQEELPRKIHPSIYAYIAYKSYSKQDVLRTPYNGKTPNADPRKWELSSKVLYKTRKPEMLRSLIGEDLTRDFVMFCSKQTLSVEDVINNNYREEDLEMNIGEKFNTAVGLSSVGDEHIEVVRNFVKRLGPEICAMFDILWIHGDEYRLEKIAELKLNEDKPKTSHI